MARSKRKYQKDSDKVKSNTKTTVAEAADKPVSGSDSSVMDSKHDSINDKQGIPSSANDPEWYSRDPRLVIDGASIPFSIPFGKELDLKGAHSVTPSGGVTSAVTSSPLPGVWTLMLKPSFGSSLDKSSPVNVAANALYTHVRYVNSGRKNYDPADLFIYAAAMGDIYSFLCWCIRLYNYAFMYSQRNFYIGRDLILAQAVDAGDILSNLANFRYWINSVINKVSSFCLPADIYFFKRRVFLYSNYYIENPYGNIKDQMYQLAPEGFFHFDFDANNAGKLAYSPIVGFSGGALNKLSDIRGYFENVLMKNITGDEDFGLMSGDILKAYGESNILHIAQIPEEAGLLPVYDQYVLSQFKNAQVAANLFKASPASTYKDMLGNNHMYGDLEQTTNGLLVTEEACDWGATGMETTSAMLAFEKLLTVENPDPTPGDVIEATRLLPALYLAPENDGSGTFHYCIQCGTEIVVSMIMSEKPASTNTDMTGASAILSNAFNAANGYLMRKHAQFKYAPLMYWGTVDGSGNITAFTYSGNCDNTTLITSEILGRLHEIALLSLFYVPGVAKLIS